MTKKRKEPFGRPQEYNAEICIKAQKYLDSCVDEEYERIKTDGDKSTSYELSVKVNLPTIEGLAVYLGVARSTVYDWKEKFKDFSDIFEKIMAIQAERLLNNSLSGTYNPKIAQLMLSKHGYAERIETDITSDGKPIVQLVNSIADKYGIINGKPK